MAHGGIVTAGHALGYVSVSVRVRVGWRGFGRVREYRPALLLWLRALVMHPDRGANLRYELRTDCWPSEREVAAEVRIEVDAGRACGQELLP